VLLAKGRGAGKDPGEFRLSQNWIGGTRPGNAVFVPPPPTAVPTAERLGETFRSDRSRLEGAGRRAGSALRVHDAFKARPIQSMSSASEATGLSFPTVSSAMELLVELGIARELTGKRRNRLFAYDRYLDVLNEGTERP
jgi:Fic family protein